MPDRPLPPPLRILIVGGYGIFGGRLVELLEDEPRLTLIVAGRSVERAREFCASRTRAKAQLLPAAFDRDGHSITALAARQVSLVVDASGPFQRYGERPYRLIEHCIELGVPYLDLADGSDFVAGISKFDEAAKRAGIYVLSGVSSFPVLTAAVVKRLSADMMVIESIRGGIAPSPFAIVGLNVIRAIASYAGKRVTLRRKGRWIAARPFTESMRFVVSTPGHVPLESRRFSLVDVPDLRTLAELWPQAQEVWMGAAPAPAPLLRALNVFAWLVRLHLLPGLSWMARSMSFVIDNVRWGEHRGGMFVRVQGRDHEGKPIVREWHLLAEGDDGPLIPCMAIEAIVRKALAGTAPAAGARTATSDVTLADYEALFSKRTLYSGVRERALLEGKPLYRRVLGSAWDDLAPQIRDLHSVTHESVFTGRCTVERGRNPLALLVGRMIGFPKAGTDQAVSVTLTTEGDGERWVRRIGGRRFSSVQHPGRGRSEWLIRERFGPVCVHMALVADGPNLRYVIRHWTLFGIRLPLWLGPHSQASESVEDGKFRFDVEIRHAFTGFIVRYRGLLSR
jgi:hypothetical protein